MKLWILRPVKDLPEDDDPWVDMYDCNFGFVIRADNESAARELAGKEVSCELRPQCNPWLKSEYTDCLELSEKGESGIIMEDFNAG